MTGCSSWVSNLPCALLHSAVGVEVRTCCGPKGSFNRNPSSLSTVVLLSLHVTNGQTIQKASVTGQNTKKQQARVRMTLGCLHLPFIQQGGTELQAGESHPAQNRHPSENTASAYHQAPFPPSMQLQWGLTQVPCSPGSLHL